MFAVRGLAVSFSVFAMVYVSLSVAVCCAWRSVWFRGQERSMRRTADLLFLTRGLPLLAAIMVTAFLVVPSFLLLEPRVTDEPFGIGTSLLAFAGIGAASYGALNAILALQMASRSIAQWLRQSQVAGSIGAVPLFRTAAAVPGLTVAGILRPRMLISDAAESVLKPRELQTALRHELAHVQRRDNLKKLALRLMAFPGMAELESSWLHAVEMAADDAAVSGPDEALDLASALIKLSRLPHAASSVAITTALAHGPAASVNARVERLIAWNRHRPAPSRRHCRWYAHCALLGTAAGLAVTYGDLLQRVHILTEWLVR
jgi:hypothetical protein